MKQNKGFTLVELMVTIAIGSIVTLSATTILLLGFRINFGSNEMSSRQNAVRIGISVLEEMAAEQAVGIEDSKTVKSKSGTVFYYDAGKDAIMVSGNALLNEVEEFTATFDADINLLTMTLKIDGVTYESKVYCRTAPVPATPTANNAPLEASSDGTSGSPAMMRLTLENVSFEARARQAFLDVLLAEEGSTGMASTGEYYSQWYIGSYEENPGWNAETPWCACFISWAAAQCEEYLKVVPKFAHVDQFMDSFSVKHWKTADPQPGDILFLDWLVDETSHPQHVGVVVSTDGEFVYTIEGNNNGKVAPGCYKLTDPRILGYGELKWK